MGGATLNLKDPSVPVDDCSQNLTNVTCSLPNINSYSWPASQTQHTLFMKAVGKSSITNHMSLESGFMPVTVVFNSAGAGHGTVTDATTGSSCHVPCALLFASGTAVSLTATPDTGNLASKFNSWNFDDCDAHSPCNFTANGNTTVGVNFDGMTFVLPSVRNPYGLRQRGSMPVSWTYSGNVVTQPTFELFISNRPAAPMTCTNFAIANGNGSCTLTLPSRFFCFTCGLMIKATDGDGVTFADLSPGFWIR